ncbi:MAG: Panacea domain-containing protein [Gammaproteobacteria bacterium]|nr:Panacea domain-containing protein [Gammaproteobacteria bacterium]
MRELQAAQVAAAFILRAGRPVGILKLTKLMYLAEREAVQRFVYPIVCDDIYAMQRGMALSRTFDLMKQKVGTRTNGEWARYIEARPHQGIGVRRGVTEDSLDGLSADDIDVIDSVWRTYGGKSNDELIHEVHHGLEEWTAHWHDENRRSSAVPVSYESLFQLLCDMPEDQASEMAAEVAYFQSLADLGEEREIA